MKIPIILADQPYDVVNTPNVGAGEMAQAQTGGAVVELSGLIAQRQAALNERERFAQDRLKAVEYNNNIAKEVLDLKGLLENDTDYDTIEARATKALSDIKDKYDPKNPSDNLKVSIESSFSQHSLSLLGEVKTTKYKVMNEKGKMAYLTAEQRAINEYIKSDNPEIQKSIKKGLEAVKNDLSSVTDPLWLHREYLGFESKVKPISEAYEVDSIVAKAVSRVKESDPNIPYDIEKRYAEVEKLTNNPSVKKAAFLELERMKRIRDQGVKERFDFSYSAISSALQNNRYLNINDIKKMPEYLALPETQRDDALAKAQVLMDQRNREERAVVAAERSADAAVRAQENQEKQYQQERFDQSYNKIMGNGEKLEKLGTMTDDEFNGLLFDVGDKNQAKLLQERLKLKKSNKYAPVARQRVDIVNNLLSNAGITNESDKTAYMDAVIEYVGNETDLPKIKEKAAVAMQHAALERRAWWFTNKVTIKVPIGTKDGKTVYQLPNDQWQVGD